MANSMAGLLVRFQTLDGIVHDNVSLATFLTNSFDVSQLSKQDQRKRDALNILYNMNGNQSELFDRFPDREHPLLFDFVQSPESGKGGGHYDPEEHKINLKDPAAEEGRKPLSEQQKIALLVATYAHEMKHCQQFDKNIQEMYAQILTGHASNGWATHQLRYLSEAQAYAFGGYVYFKAFGSCAVFKDGNEQNYETYKDQYAPIEAIHKKYGQNATWQEVERELIEGWLKILYKGTAKGYRNFYHRSTKVNKATDVGVVDIPKEFRLQSQDIRPILAQLKKAPKSPTKKYIQKIRKIKKSKKLKGKVLQCLRARLSMRQLLEQNGKQTRGISQIER